MMMELINLNQIINAILLVQVIYIQKKGYYFESQKYKKCYISCKECNGYGDSNNHNCIECKYNYPYEIIKTDSKDCFNTCPSNSYPKENEYLCLIEKPEGYYLDSNVYKQCYESCNNCNRAGNENDHNCIECKFDYPFELIKTGSKNCSNIKYCTDSSICPSNYNKLISEKDECVNKCDDDETYKFELNNNCYITCPTDSYPIENEYFCFIEKPVGYYLDLNIYKQCYESCFDCNGAGNENYHNCTECKSDFPYELIKTDYKNCYNSCPYYFYLDKSSNTKICTESFNCPSNYKKLIVSKNECVNKCEDDMTYKYELDYKCYDICPDETYPKENENLCLTEKPEGYYLASLIYKECYESCKNCKGAGDLINNNCSECKNTYPYEIMKSGFKNCYISCPHYFYLDKNTNIKTCSESRICPLSYNKLISEKNECVNKCEEDGTNKYEFNNECFNICPGGTFPKQDEYLCLTEKQEGYYLDSNIYKKCYISCKYCNGAGNEETHNCNECKSDYPYEVIKSDSINCYNACPDESFTKDNEYLCFTEKPIGYYFYSSKYIKCYESCKNCFGAGNEENHNCNECKVNYPYILNKIGYKNCYNTCPYNSYIEKTTNTKYCTENQICPSNYDKLITDKKECLEKCEEDEEYKYEFENECYINCPDETYPKENEYLCFREKPEGYYFDSNIYKKCYVSCKNCNIAGNIDNHNCNECNDNYPYEIIRTDYKNCYNNCPYYYYIDKATYNKYCTESQACPLNYYKLITEKNECVNKCDDDGTYKFEFENKCYISCPIGTYPIEDGYLCFKVKPEGYYFDSNIYKKCYVSCKNCNGAGNIV